MTDRHRIRSAAGAGLTALASAAAGLAAGWIAYSRLAVDHDLPLPPALDAERVEFGSGRAGRLSCYADRSGSGVPLALLHSVNAAASAYEMRPLFERYAGERPVFALDLPGFGFSQRADRVYSPGLYASAILDFLCEVVQAPADVIALSLSGEFAARAALAEPQRTHSLTLISPTGFAARCQQPPTAAHAGPSLGQRLSRRLLSWPLWSQPIFDALTLRPSLHYFLQKSFVGPVDPGLEAYSYLTAHQPGARFAPLYFVTGQLFTPTVYDEFYERLTQPVMVIYDEDPYTSFGLLPEMLSRPRWHNGKIPSTRGLPHFEKPIATTQALDRFWRALAEARA